MCSRALKQQILQLLSTSIAVLCTRIAAIAYLYKLLTEASWELCRKGCCESPGKCKDTSSNFHLKVSVAMRPMSFSECTQSGKTRTCAVAQALIHLSSMVLNAPCKKAEEDCCRLHSHVHQFS